MTKQSHIFKGRVLAMLDDDILAWQRLWEEAGPNADVTVETVIDSLQLLRERIHGQEADSNSRQ